MWFSYVSSLEKVNLILNTLLGRISDLNMYLLFRLIARYKCWLIHFCSILQSWNSQVQRCIGHSTRMTYRLPTTAWITSTHTSLQPLVVKNTTRITFQVNFHPFPKSSKKLMQVTFQVRAYTQFSLPYPLEFLVCIVFTI